MSDLKNWSDFSSIFRHPGPYYFVFLFMCSMTTSHLHYCFKIQAIWKPTQPKYWSLYYKNCHCWILPFLAVLYQKKYLYNSMIFNVLYRELLNDLEFPPILLVSDWPRRHLLECTSEWVDRKCLTTVYSGSLWCHNENADFRVNVLLKLTSLVCIFLWRHNIRTSFRAEFFLRLTTPWTFLCY